MDVIELDYGVVKDVSFASPTVIECKTGIGASSFFISRSGNDNTWIEIGDGDRVKLVGDVKMVQYGMDKVKIPAMENIIVSVDMFADLTSGGGGGGTANFTNALKKKLQDIKVIDITYDSATSVITVTKEGSTLPIKVDNFDSTTFKAPGAENSIGLNTGDDSLQKVMDKLNAYKSKEGSRTTFIKRANDTKGVAPSVEITTPVKDDNAIVQLLSGDTEFYTYNGTAWIHNFDISPAAVFKDPVADMAALKAVKKPINGETRQDLSRLPLLIHYVFNTGTTTGASPNDGTPGTWLEARFSPEVIGYPNATPPTIVEGKPNTIYINTDTDVPSYFNTGDNTYHRLASKLNKRIVRLLKTVPANTVIDITATTAEYSTEGDAIKLVNDLNVQEVMLNGGYVNTLVYLSDTTLRFPIQLYKDSIITITNT